LNDTKGQDTLRQQYEVTVIGGGIHGAGIAQAAAAAGYSVLLLEKKDWASGTSSKSSKLIHGGLRYLQTGQFSLVRESIREREILLEIAPDLVHRNHFYIPLYAGSHYRSWQLHIGLCLYALFGLNRKACRYRVLTNDQAQHLNGLQKAGLKKVFCYPDAQTDDALLTRAVIDSARSLGAHACNPANLLAAKHVGDGYRLKIDWQNTDHEVFSQLVVNAGGPWANLINSCVTPAPPCANVDLVQGTHLVLAGQISSECFYLEAPQDQRAVFVLPWKGNTLLGTTETTFEGDPDQVAPRQDEEEYLLTVLKHYFPSFNPQVLERFAGLRVLPRDEARHAFHRSRETQLLCDNPCSPRWISVYGGKLTGYRATAQKAVKLMTKSLGRKSARADTRKLLLTPATNESATPRANYESAD
jgi:glycerol-3-phosphate dehydrogenase